PARKRISYSRIQIPMAEGEHHSAEVLRRGPSSVMRSETSARGKSDRVSPLNADFGILPRAMEMRRRSDGVRAFAVREKGRRGPANDVGIPRKRAMGIASCASV